MNSQTEIVPDTTRPSRSMTDQHRKNLSEAIKRLWAARGGQSIEHRQKLSVSAKKRWARRKRMSDELRQKIAVPNKNP